MSYSKEIYNAFADFFSKNGLRYDFEQNQERFCLEIPVKCKLKSVKMYVALYDTRYSVYAMMPYHADREDRPNVAEFVARVNYGMNFGFFETDVRDGEVRFRMEMDCDGRSPSLSMIRDSILVAVMNVEKYGDALLGVMLGYLTVKQALAQRQ